MNQEQNNFNSNNFNTQGSKGVHNNQPLNNQNIDNSIYKNQGIQQNTNFNQSAFNSQPQRTSSYEYQEMQEPMSQPVNTFESDSSSNQKFNSRSQKKINLGLIIGIVAAVAVVVVGIVFGSKLLSNINSDNQNITNKSDAETSTVKSIAGKYIIYLNNMKIILGVTTMDEIIKNTDLEVIKDETNKCEGCYTSDNIGLEIDHSVEYDSRIIQLSDGINIFVITSYFEKTNIVGEITTLRNNRLDDPAFDNSKGTVLSFEDEVIGKRINIGYTFTEDEIYDAKGYCYGDIGVLYCPQIKQYSEDMFVYYFDNNLKLVNMEATLMSYYK